MHNQVKIPLHQLPNGNLVGIKIEDDTYHIAFVNSCPTSAVTTTMKLSKQAAIKLAELIIQTIT